MKSPPDFQLPLETRGSYSQLNLLSPTDKVQFFSIQSQEVQHVNNNYKREKFEP